MKILLNIGRKDSYSGLVGVCSNGKTYLFSKRAGQTWMAKGLPSNIPSSIHGEHKREFIGDSIYLCSTAGLWRLGKEGNYIPVNQMAKKLSVPGLEVGAKEHTCALVMEYGKLHVRFNGYSYRVRWERVSDAEMAMYLAF